MMLLQNVSIYLILLFWVSLLNLGQGWYFSTLAGDFSCSLGGKIRRGSHDFFVHQETEVWRELQCFPDRNQDNHRKVPGDMS